MIGCALESDWRSSGAFFLRDEAPIHRRLTESRGSVSRSRRVLHVYLRTVGQRIRWIQDQAVGAFDAAGYFQRSSEIAANRHRFQMDDTRMIDRRDLGALRAEKQSIDRDDAGRILELQDQMHGRVGTRSPITAGRSAASRV